VFSLFALAGPADPDERPTLDPDGWVRSHGDSLYRFALMRLRNPELAENAVQETLLAAYAGRDSFSGRSSERTWLMGILKRKIVDHFRKAGRERPVEDVDALSEPTEAAFTDRGRWKVGPRRWGGSPGADLEKAEFWRVLETCLEGLPPRLGQAFILLEIDQLESKEVCNSLEITSTNLWVMMHRARMRLRQCLQDRWFGADRGA
jgi:RNA polymerase sigma-70 factor (ECF subfamily)